MFSPNVYLLYKISCVLKKPWKEYIRKIREMNIREEGVYTFT